MRDAPATDATPRALLARLGVSHPILQAPMAGVATPALAAAVSEAGGLGSLGLGPISAAGARTLLAEMRMRTDRPFGVNLFCAPSPPRDAAKEAAWLERLRPAFETFGAEPPERLEPPFGSSLADPEMLPLLLDTKPALVSFHMGLPEALVVTALRRAGIVLIATATSLAEALQVERGGFDAVVAQGIEAGGHRGVFDPDADDARLHTLDLVRMVTPRLSIPVIAAGGVMDGSDIAKMLRAGAAAAQLGTAFLCCPEASGHDLYRAAIQAGEGTVLTRAVTGRPARAVANALSALAGDAPPGEIPAFPLPAAASRALAAAAAPRSDYSALWAGTGLAHARAMPAAALMQALVAELARSKQQAGRAL
jgi:nitronate monooxygenase